jgi:N-acetyl sugar amidotransferase
MDTSDKEIVFDSDGYCNHCNDFFKNVNNHSYQGHVSDISLQKILDTIKKSGRNRQYDCLIGVSGGVDSSYVAYLSKLYGLKPLFVHFDNGWNTELSIKNVENIIKHLGSDYQTYIVDWNEFRDVQMAFLKASVIDVEAPTDHAFLAALYRIADEHKIKYIITGSNYATECIMPRTWSYNAKDLRQLRSIYNRYGKSRLKTFPTLGLLKEMFYTYFKGIKLVRILQYVPYRKSDAMKTLNDEIGWQYYGGKHYESFFTRFTQAYMLPEKFKVDKRRAHLSTLICNGELTRDEALKLLEDDLYPPDMLRNDIDFVCRKFGISPHDFDELMNMPPKSYKDYPNSEQALSLVYKIYGILKRQQL